MCGSGAIGTEHLRPCDCITLLQVIQYLHVSEKGRTAPVMYNTAFHVGVIIHPLLFGFDEQDISRFENRRDVDAKGAQLQTYARKYVAYGPQLLIPGSICERFVQTLAAVLNGYFGDGAIVEAGKHHLVGAIMGK